MLSVFVTYLVVLILIPKGTASQSLRPQCSAKGVNGINRCDDRPECPRTSCRCVFASRMDCATYYQCVNGKPYQYRCSSGLLFNAETLTCDYSSNVNCTSSTIAETSSTEMTAASELTTSSLPTNISTESDLTTIMTRNQTDYNITTLTSTPANIETTKAEFSTTVKNETTPEITTTEAKETTTLRLTTDTTELSSIKTSSLPSEKTIVTTEIFTTEASTTTTEISEVESSTTEITSKITNLETSTTTISITEDTTSAINVTNFTLTTKTDEETASETNAASSTPISVTAVSNKTNVTVIVPNSSVSPTFYYSTEGKTSPHAYTSTILPSDFVCSSRFGLFADPRSCFRFYHCSHWIPYHKWCPSNLHFSPRLTVCDWPDRAGCDILYPSSTVTESISSTSTLEPNITVGTCHCDCCELPVPDDCSAYILCIDKVSFKMHCSHDLYFNPMTGTCDLKGNVKCANDELQCPEPSGRFQYPGSCSYFTECQNGEKTVKKCPEGLYFNESSEMCGWTESCTGESSDLNPSSKTLANITVCNSCNYCFKPNNSDCSRYVKCSHNIATEERCAAGLFFNPDAEMCDHDYNVDCSKPEPEPACPENSGFFAYPGECGKYLHCINGNATVKSCPGVLDFSAQKKHCDWPWVAGCQNSDVTPTLEPEPTTVACDCECCLKPVENDCQSFIICISKVGFKRSCSSGLFYNPQMENCDFAENVNCTLTPDKPTFQCPEYQGLFSHPDDCQKFIHCSNGYPHIKNCPSDLHFNPTLKVCDWPYAAGCQGFPTVEPPTDDPNIPCDICNSCFIPDENNCASYVYCLNGTGHKLRCTGDLLFNPEIESCDIASNVNCPNQPNSRCPEPDGLFPAEDCAQFIHCSNGIAYLKDCPEGLHFNVQTLVCDWPENAKCGDASAEPITSGDQDVIINRTCNCECCFIPNTKDCSNYFLCLDGYLYDGQCSKGLLFNPSIQNCDKAERVTCGELSPLCPAPNGLFPNPEECSSFYRCSSGMAELQHCPNGKHFCAERKQCLDPCHAKCDSIYDCNSTTTLSTPASSSTTVSTTTSTISPYCLEKDGLFPNEDDCTTFYQCSAGRAYFLKCPPGLHFSNEHQVCEYPCNANCNKTIDCNSTTSLSTSTSSSTTVSTTSTISPHCLEENGLFPNEDDCTTFYQCSAGRAYFLKCPSGLHFSYEHQVCEHPCVANCNKTLDCYLPTSLSPSTSSSTTVSTISTISPYCFEKDGLFPNEDDCTTFYQCSAGRAYFLKCPSGLHFSYEYQVCEHPCDAGCNKTIDCSSPTILSTPRSSPSTVLSTTTISPHCLEKDGLFPNKDDCTTFYQCSAGRAYFLKCPPGLHFSNEHQVCEYPCIANCDQTIDCSPTTASSTLIIINSTLSSHCQSSDGIFPAVGDCTAFYLCSNGKGHLIQCPPGLHYSEKHEICEDPYVACCNTSTDCTSTTKQASTTPLTIISPECKEANGIFPNPNNCGSFYQCSNGKSYLVQCPSGLHFSPDDEICERPCVAGCDISTACPTEIPDTEGNCTCENCYLPDPADCSAFYFCSNWKLTKGYCPFGMLFDKMTDNCENEDSVNCEANGDPSMCPKPFGYFPYPGDCKKFVYCEDSIAHIKECEEDLEFDPVNKMCTQPKGYCGETVLDSHCVQPTGLFPDPKNCSLFYHCEHGVAYLKHCSPPLKFNQEKEVCDWPENVACGEDATSSYTPTASSLPTKSYSNGSTQGSTYSSRSPTSSTVITSTNESCYEVPGVICPCACRVPTYDECSSFFHCQDDGTACKKFCPEGLYFNKREMVCDLPSNVECRDFFFTAIKRAKLLTPHSRSSIKT